MFAPWKGRGLEGGQQAEGAETGQCPQSQTELEARVQLWGTMETMIRALKA